MKGTADLTYYPDSRRFTWRLVIAPFTEPVQEADVHGPATEKEIADLH
jgi:hypothetical protein